MLADGWYNPPAGTPEKAQPTGMYPEFMLFDIEKDPTEDENIIDAEQDDLQKTVTYMKNQLATFKTQVLPHKESKKVSAGIPGKHNNTWVSGWC